MHETEVVWHNAHGEPVVADIVNESQFLFEPTAFEPEWDYNDPYQFCGGCGKELLDIPDVSGYDRRTGARKIVHYIGCSTLNPTHDRWEKLRNPLFETF